MESYKPQKNVIHVTSDEKSRNYLWERDSDKVSKNIEIVSVDELQSLPFEARRKMFSVQDIEEGMVFVKDPFSSRYYLASEVADKLSDNKYNALSRIAMYLGAKRIVREIESVKTKSREFNSETGVTYKVVDVGLNIHSSSTEGYKKRYNKEEIFDGIATESGYQKAVEYCEKTGLIYDDSIQYLLEARNPKNDNKKRHEDIRTEITSECENSLDIAFSLNVLKGVFSLNAKCEHFMKMTDQVIVHSRIEF